MSENMYCGQVVSVAGQTKEGMMTVTLLTVQTLTGSGTAITTLLPYPHPQSHRICTNYKSDPGSPGEQLLHLLHTSYATGGCRDTD